MYHVFLVHCMPGYFLLGGRHCEFYLAWGWIFCILMNIVKLYSETQLMYLGTV